ncbi:MAG TPA: peptidoglycan DD-metalloendopeptidase family protein [Saprospiraceae bacterium]|jgi:murein DD-endopeptidase MepM/ murein hydrolase activator NlpD|nr:MAG: peptidase M23 [Candidatus Parvibacillus calidus]HRP84194.1 peptidoglycan DD-metalloendopeptidase family protein [Saprospiraceae bacterium]
MMGQTPPKIVFRKNIKLKPQPVKQEKKNKLSFYIKWSVWSLVTFVALFIFYRIVVLGKPEISPKKSTVSPPALTDTLESAQEPSEDSIYSIIYNSNFSNYRIVPDILEEDMNADDFFGMFHIHPEKKAKAEMLLGANARFTVGTRIVTLYSKDDVEIPLYIYIEPDPSRYRYISFEKDIPEISNYIKRNLTIETEKRKIVIGKDALENITEQAPAELLGRISHVMSWKKDIGKLDEGDVVKVAYEGLYYNKIFMGVGKLMALEWKGKEDSLKAFLVSGEYDNEGRSVYCTEKGRPLKEAFRKSPVAYGRISSRFGIRLHPVRKVVKAHNGTDFASPEGSPIFAIGDGVVTVAAFKKANGNYIKIMHDKTYTTQYLHMSRFKPGIVAGKRVRQGDVIGYVGHTGEATGPHVCLRLWKNAVQVDFLKEKFPQQGKIKAFDAKVFQSARDYYSKQLENI